MKPNGGLCSCMVLSSSLCRSFLYSGIIENYSLRLFVIFYCSNGLRTIANNPTLPQRFYKCKYKIKLQAVGHELTRVNNPILFQCILRVNWKTLPFIACIHEVKWRLLLSHGFEFRFMSYFLCSDMIEKNYVIIH